MEAYEQLQFDSEVYFKLQQAEREATQTVTVARVIYTRRDYTSQIE